MTAAHRLPFLAAAGELGRLIGAYDWDATALGPIADWPAPLRTAVGLVLESPRPMLVWGGPEFVVLYNDAFKARAGRIHPGALGARGEDAFADIWPTIGPALRPVLATGAATHTTDQPLLLQRDGGPEETYWSFSHSPIRGEDGSVLGVFTTADESTHRLVGERRRATLRAVADLCTARIGRTAPDPDEVAVAAVDALARNPRDLPFAALCLAGPAPDRELRVAAAHGIGRGIDGELPPISAVDATEEAPRYALRTGRRVVVDGLRTRFPGAFPAPESAPGPLEPDTAVVLPLRGPAGVRPGEDRSGIEPHGAERHDGEPIGVLVLGTSPYQALDDDVLAFLDLVEAQCSAAIADAVQQAGERQRAGDEPAAPNSALLEERERYRTLVTQAPVGIWVTDRRGATTFVNEQVTQLLGRPAAELVGTSWTDQVHPEDREAAAAGWAAAVRGGAEWENTHRVSGVDGAVREIRSSARPLRSADGEITGFLGTTTDVTEERRAEQMRRDAATEHAAREASEAAAARLAAMVQGLAAIVWEADWRPDEGGLRFTFVSDRAEELLGHPAARWRDDPDFWPALVHPDDRAEALSYTSDHTAAGADHDLTYRAVAIDGRVLWLHQVVHVVTDPEGRPVAAQGLTVDVTEQQRAERSAALLAETGRLVAQDGTAEERLTELARLVVHDLGDAAFVSMIGVDGLLRRIAVAHDDPAVVDALLAIGPTTVPPALAERFAPGRPVTVPITEKLHGAVAHDETAAQARDALRTSNCLVVPLLIGDRVVGMIGFLNFGASRHYQPSELDLAAELGRRASLMLAADRQHTRERHLQQVSADLASAASVAEAARLLVARLPDILDAGGVGVYLADAERGLRLVHSVGYPEQALEVHSRLRLDERVPIAQGARTGEPVWIGSAEDWERDWAHLAEGGHPTGRSAHAALPLTAVGRVVGMIALDFPTRRAFPADERDFVLALVAQAAPAFERAAAADERRMIAETLQTSLLPPTLPRLDRLPLASRYLPGARGSQAGGDWYDVLPLDAGRVAIAVGDVVGQGARAAAIMGQLRSALSSYLLEGHDPDQALERLDRFAGRVPGAGGSTVACLTLDPETGELSWARAGHPAPLVAGPDGCRPLENAAGTVLGVRTRPPFTAGTARIEPGESIVLYTDGLVERRGEVVDDGIERLAAIAARHHTLGPAALTDALLAGALDGGEGHGDDAYGAVAPADDVALIVARLVPGPLRLVLPAEATMLRELRASVLEWTTAAGIDEEDVYDLQLAVGEAAANAVEHAYRDRPPGPMSVELVRDADGDIAARVHDEGTWRPVPGDRGFRGRGLELIRDVSSRMQLHHGPTGTQVRFTLPPSGHPPVEPPEPRPAAPSAAPAPAGPAALQVDDGPEGRSVEVHGELDLAGVRGVRDELLRLAGAGGALTMDLRPTTYLASAGVALLVEADRVVRSAGGRLRLRAAPANVVRRALALSGMDDLLDVLESGA